MIALNKGGGLGDNFWLYSSCRSASSFLISRWINYTTFLKIKFLNVIVHAGRFSFLISLFENLVLGIHLFESDCFINFSQ